MSRYDHDVVVIGSGFGGAMTALPLAREFKHRERGESILTLERGTWWTTPVSTVQDKEVHTYDFLRKERGQPVQFWSSAESFRGFLDIFTRCVRRRGNEDGLYDLTNFGRRGLFGLRQNDGVTILRASGVGGGSLVYANVTIRPPDEVLDDPRWPLTWRPEQRDEYFELARQAIGRGVGWALHKRGQQRGLIPADQKPPDAPNTGLSNIVTRSAYLDPRWVQVEDRLNPGRGVKRIDPLRPAATHALWIDRARVFQTEMSHLTADYGTVDSSINDLRADQARAPGVGGGGPAPFDPDGKAKNYCERHGRCIVGCLPGARHTLNKQLMGAALGKPDGTAPAFPDLHVEALCEARLVEALPDGGYRVHYWKRDHQDPKRYNELSVTAERVILAAGCVGTNELLLRSAQEGTLPGLSDKLGFGFSTNGDYLAFLPDCKVRLSLTRGPVTTSFAHFGSPMAAPDADVARFHTIEDNGIPRAFSAIAGHGTKLLVSLSKGRRPRVFVVVAVARYALRRVSAFVRALLRNHTTRQDEFASEDEWTDTMMCVAAMGREASIGQFRLGGRRDTTLRVARTDGKAFDEDPIYADITSSLSRFARRLTDDGRDFINPFLTETAGALGGRSIGLSHPLGGCRMAASAADGVCDEHGRVFDTRKTGPDPVHRGLYIADAARIPTALGVNPSLTISALALRTADRIIEELPRAAAGEAEAVGPPAAAPTVGP